MPEPSSHISGFAYDVFVSYSHIDNEDEWVSRLHEHIRRAVDSKLGHRANFFRDPRLKTGAILDPALKEAVRNSAVFLAVLSPGYCESDYCKQELKWFADFAQGETRLAPGQGRLIVVEKDPPEQ